MSLRRAHPHNHPPGSSSATQQLYYSQISFLYMGPLGLLYSWAARAWLRLVAVGAGGKKSMERPLPSPAAVSQAATTNHHHRPERVAIVTGSNTGIGFETAKALAVDYGCTVILACRSRDRAERAAAAINDHLKTAANAATAATATTSNAAAGRAVFVHPLDLASPDSVRAFARQIRSRYRKIDVLVNNAGRNNSTASGDDGSASPPLDASVVRDGDGDGASGQQQQQQQQQHEKKLDPLFQSNFLGHYLLTSELMPLLLAPPPSGGGGSGAQHAAAAAARVVNVASAMHHFAGTGFDVASVGAWRRAALADTANANNAYARSKLAAVLLTGELNRRYNNRNDSDSSTQRSKIQSIAVNPGAVHSDIWRHYPRFMDPVHRMLYLNSRQGCRTSVAACVLEDNDIPDRTLFPYLQPYWQPFDDNSNSNDDGPLFPALELMGPYQGYRWTPARVPAGSRGVAAAQALWTASQELTGAQWPE